MKNYVQPGKTITVAAPANVLSGAGVKVGALFGVAAFDALSGADVEIVTQGVFDLPKTSAQAWASVGLLIYWDDSEKECTTTASTNLCIGVNVATAANPSDTGRVRLNIGPQGIQGIQGEPG